MLDISDIPTKFKTPLLIIFFAIKQLRIHLRGTVISKFELLDCDISILQVASIAGQAV